MTERLGPASELDAVNELLASIGEDPVTSMDELPPSGNTALALLRATSRNLQESGFYFNTETGWSFSPDSDGFITVSDTILSADPTDTTLDVILRGRRFYDKANRTYVFTSPLECDIIRHLPWDELSGAARWYFTAVAMEQFTESFPGSDATLESRTRNLMRAQAAFKREELKAGDYNLISKSNAVQTILRRT